MNCNDIHSNLTRYLLKDLPPARAAVVRKHLETCERCQAAAKEIEPTLELLRSALTASQPQASALSPERRKRVLATRPQPVAPPAKVLNWFGSQHPYLRCAASFAVIFCVVWAVSGKVILHLTEPIYRDFGKATPSSGSAMLQGPFTAFLPIFKMGEVVGGESFTVTCPQWLVDETRLGWDGDDNGRVSGDESGSDQKAPGSVSMGETVNRDFFKSLPEPAQDETKPETAREDARPPEEQDEEGAGMSAASDEFELSREPQAVAVQGGGHGYVEASTKEKKDTVAYFYRAPLAATPPAAPAPVVQTADEDARPIEELTSLSEASLEGERPREPQSGLSTDNRWEANSPADAQLPAPAAPAVERVYFAQSVGRYDFEGDQEIVDESTMGVKGADVSFSFEEVRAKLASSTDLDTKPKEEKEQNDVFSVNGALPAAEPAPEEPSRQIDSDARKRTTSEAASATKGFSGQVMVDKVSNELGMTEESARKQDVADEKKARSTADDGELTVGGGATAAARGDARPPKDLNGPDVSSLEGERPREPQPVATVTSSGVIMEKKPPEDLSGPRFKATGVNPVVETRAQPFSTFGIDVDTASYTLSRNYMLKGFLPPAEAVRTEEFVNFFDYGYEAPARGTFRVYVDCTPTPFAQGLNLMKIGVKGMAIGREKRQGLSLTLVIDTSGSMNTSDRLDLIKRSLVMLLEKLAPNDKLAIIQFNSRATLVLEHTPARERDKILAALKSLQTSGSTNLELAMRLAYETAARGFVPGAANRVMIMSDGAANLGTDAATDILATVSEYRQKGIFCSVLGFGIGTYNDEMLEALANNGDGTYSFIDSEAEAKRVLVDEMSATLNTIAKDVKIQVEFNPLLVAQYRQLGYENRQLKKEQFRDDTVDAGEVGSGQAVTALYEYGVTRTLRHDPQDWLAVVRVRYRRLDTGTVEEIERRVTAADLAPAFENAAAPVRLAAAVAEFAEILRASPFAEGSSYEDVARVLRPLAMEMNLDTRLQELLRMVHGARGMSRGQ